MLSNYIPSYWTEHCNFLIYSLTVSMDCNSVHRRRHTTCVFESIFQFLCKALTNMDILKIDNICHGKVPIVNDSCYACWGILDFVEECELFWFVALSLSSYQSYSLLLVQEIIRTGTKFWSYSFGHVIELLHK